MALLLSVAHRCLDLACRPMYLRYWQYANQVMNIQNMQLKKILKHQGLPELSYAQFAAQFPLTSYEHVQNKIQHHIVQKTAYIGQSRIQHYQTEYCSAQLTKYLPYTQNLIQELDHALSVWFVGLYQQYPQLKNTSHYWQAPQDAQLELPHHAYVYRDTLVLSVSKRAFHQAMRAVPMSVAWVRNEKDRLFATAVYLVADRDLGLLSLWNPVHGLALLEMIRTTKDEMIAVLRSGCWQRPSLKMLKAPKACEQSYKLQRLDLNIAASWAVLWSKLQVISSYQHAQHEKAARQLQAEFPHATFEAKGVWRTEGMISFPFQGRHPLAYQSHFYEFIELRSLDIVTATELKSGDVVCPILTTSAGLLRYVLTDVLEVTEFFLQIPCFKYLGKHCYENFYVGDKQVEQAQQILKQFKPSYIASERIQNHG